MSGPQPKTKAQELIELINIAVASSELSEFQYYRCKRLIRDIGGEHPMDWALMTEGIVEMYFDNPNKALSLAKKVLFNTDQISYLIHLHFIFMNCMALDLANINIKRIVEMCKQHSVDLHQHIPRDFRVISHFLDGDIDNLDIGIIEKDPENSYDYLLLREASKILEISESNMKEIRDIVFTCFSARNVRCRKIEYSFLEDEFLIMLHIDRDFDFIRALDSEIFSKCFKRGLHEDLNKLSYFILPFDYEAHNDAG